MRATVIVSKGDAWGLGFQFYPSDWAIHFQFLCWYLLIEKAWK